MKKDFLEVIKANKREIITKGIVLLASIGGLFIAANILTKNQKPDEDEIFEDDYDNEDGDSDTSSEE